MQSPADTVAAAVSPSLGSLAVHSPSYSPENHTDVGKTLSVPAEWQTVAALLHLGVYCQLGVLLCYFFRAGPLQLPSIITAVLSITGYILLLFLPSWSVTHQGGGKKLSVAF